MPLTATANFGQLESLGVHLFPISRDMLAVCLAADAGESPFDLRKNTLDEEPLDGLRDGFPAHFVWREWLYAVAPHPMR